MEGINWLTKNIIVTLSDILGNFLDIFGSLINSVSWLTTVVSDTVEVQNVITFTIALAYVLLIATTLKQIIDIYGLHTSGDSNESPVEVVYRASISSVLIASSELFYSQFFKFTTFLEKDIGKVTTTKTITEQCDTLLKLENTMIAGVLMVFITVIGVIIFFITTSIRAAQLMLFRILYPIFAIDRSFSNKERWSNFFQSYASCFLGFVLQVLCFNMFRLEFTRLGLIAGGFNYVNVLGWLILAIKAPSWLDKYAFKSGVGEGLSRALSQAGSILMMRAM